MYRTYLMDASTFLTCRVVADGPEEERMSVPRWKGVSRFSRPGSWIHTLSAIYARFDDECDLASFFITPFHPQSQVDSLNLGNSDESNLSHGCDQVSHLSPVQDGGRHSAPDHSRIYQVSQRIGSANTRPQRHPPSVVRPSAPER
jgi:hypothetical protein